MVDEFEMAIYRLVWYHVMNNGVVEEQNAFFERLDLGMKNHLKPLFIRGKVENMVINKILVDRREVMNLMPQYML